MKDTRRAAALRLKEFWEVSNSFETEEKRYYSRHPRPCMLEVELAWKVYNRKQQQQQQQRIRKKGMEKGDGRDCANE